MYGFVYRMLYVYMYVNVKDNYVYLVFIAFFTSNLILVKQITLLLIKCVRIIYILHIQYVSRYKLINICAYLSCYIMTIFIWWNDDFMASLQRSDRRWLNTFSLICNIQHTQIHIDREHGISILQAVNNFFFLFLNFVFTLHLLDNFNFFFANFQLYKLVQNTFFIVAF